MGLEERASILPTGTVTFLLGDADPTSGADAVRIEEVLATAIAGRGGVSGGGGTGQVVAAFPSAADAVAAALEVQRALQDKDAANLRLALHTGEARRRDDRDYAGAALDRGTRLRDVAHGGQILLSSAIEAATQDRLPDDVRITSMGTWRMEGIPRPQELFQADAPDLVTGFPPLRRVVAVTAG
jgi:class 3 adenylate cyclase